MEKKKVYITTTLPYVNASPHIGFATELIRADAFARYQKIIGKDVFFNTGTDEHGQKIYDRAIEDGVSPQEYVDSKVEEYKALLPELDILSDVNFIRTTDQHHKVAAQEMWLRCKENGDIYKARHQVKYCKGCELEKTDSELVDGRCSLHPNYEIEIREEENYFFRFSKFQEPLLEFYKENPDFVVPDFRMKEVTKFVESGLRDFSVSRLKEKMAWGVPVPDDEAHVMYVWFDALTSYISSLGWPLDEHTFAEFWGDDKGRRAIQFAGKDNLRQQCAIWQAMLISAQLPTSKQICVGGFIMSDGQKMSKSIGNVISPKDLAKRYGTDATRYLLLRHVHPFEDTDITWERLDEWYTANLVNGLGNLTARLLKMSESNGITWKDYMGEDRVFHDYPGVWDSGWTKYDLQGIMDTIWSKITALDVSIQQTEPFKKIKIPETKDEAKRNIATFLSHLLRISYELEPLMPSASIHIRNAILANKKPENLFPRIN